MKRGGSGKQKCLIAELLDDLGCGGGGGGADVDESETAESRGSVMSLTL